MAKIPLRAYNREIENLINRGQIDEAIGHCKHILRFFPKHIDTYRLLGKAFLEGQHYAEASDVLQRVLSTVPDDFISQIGMSIIREDEGNLDAAIWHMEHAFEVQPANAAVQGELRRLYGRRDGIEPPKVRLTRGALVRMYARGELYQQAIGEIRSALAEDPKRIDLEVILARMYFLTGMKVEATEVCSRLITKLPFCFEANRILSEVLPETARSEDAKIYQQRVDAMDPYAAYISPSSPTLANVPDNVVTVDRLEWDSADNNALKPEWARTVGIDWEEQKDALPEWMDATIEASGGAIPALTEIELPEETQPPQEKASSVSQDLPPIPEEKEIPDWMKAAGWEKSTGEEQPPAENAFVENETPQEELTNGEIPDWLKEIAPQATVEETAPPEDQERLRLLDSLLPGTDQTPDSDQATEEVVEESVSESDLPEWLNAEPTPLGGLTGESSGKEAPDWLASLAAMTGENQAQFSQTANVPEWLQSAGAAAAVSPLPDPYPSEKNQPQIPVDQNNPQEILEPASSIEVQGSGLVPENPDDAFAWLENLAGNKDAAEETLPAEPVESNKIQPETPQEEQPEIASHSEPVVIPTPAVLEIAESNLENDIPDWLKDLQPDSLPEEPAIAAEIPQVESGVEVDAIQSLGEIIPSLESEEAPQPANELTDNLEIPDWLTETSVESEETPEPALIEPATGLFPQEAEELPLPMDEFGLLEKEVATGLSPQLNESGIELPVDSTESLPGSTLEGDRAPSDGFETPLEETAELPQEETAAENEAPVEMPTGILQETPETANLEETIVSETIPAAGDSDLLEELETDFGGAVLPAWMKAPEPESVPGSGEDENVPDWLKEAEAEASAKGTSTTDLPDWLQLLETQAEPAPEPIPEIPVETPVEISELTTPTEEASAWLETLEEKRSEGDSQLISEENLANPPEWVKDQEPEPAAEAEAVIENETEEGSAVEVVSGELPDWLKDLESERASQTEMSTPVSEETIEFSSSVEEEIPQEPEPVNEWIQELSGSTIPSEGTLEPVDETEVEDTQPVIVAPILEEEEIPQEAVEIPVDAQPVLERARTALKDGNLQDALEDYLALIKKNQALEATVQDLKDALYQYPTDIDLWQTMGDAFAHSNHLQDALDSYAKAEELLR